MPNPVLERVEAILTAESFISEFEEFARKHCKSFTDSEENALEYSAIYDEFLKLFSERFESAIQSAGVDEAEFEQECAKDRSSFVVQLLMSITSFDEFKQLMIYQKSASS